MNIHMTGEQKQRILVVDDSEDMRDLLQRLLERVGYHVIVAADGQASLTQAKLHHPDLVLMDLSLPDMDGWEAVRHLRKMREFATIPDYCRHRSCLSPGSRARHGGRVYGSYRQALRYEGVAPRSRPPVDKEEECPWHINADCRVYPMSQNHHMATNKNKRQSGLA